MIKVGDIVIIHQIDDDINSVFTQTIWPDYVGEIGTVRHVFDDGKRRYHITFNGDRPDFTARRTEIAMVQHGFEETNFEL